MCTCLSRFCSCWKGTVGRSSTIKSSRSRSRSGCSCSSRYTCAQRVHAKTSTFGGGLLRKHSASHADWVSAPTVPFGTDWHVFKTLPGGPLNPWTGWPIFPPCDMVQKNPSLGASSGSVAEVQYSWTSAAVHAASRRAVWCFAAHSSHATTMCDGRVA